jgi:hypothetical protein
MEDKERLDRITETIIGVAIDVHRTLGPGLLESAYESCLGFDLVARGLCVERQKAVPLTYKGMKLDCGYRLINFDVTALQRGIRRVVNSYPDSRRPLRPSAASALKGNVP